MKPVIVVGACVVAACGLVAASALVRAAWAQREPRAFAPPANVAEWIETAPPTGDELRGANLSAYGWCVTRQGDKIIAVPQKGFVPETVTIPFQLVPQNANVPPLVKPGESLYRKSLAERVAGGWLLASDKGEWGGDIYWYSEDGKRRHKIYGANAGPFVRNAQGELFALYGLAHMGLRRGGVLRLAPVEGDKNDHRGGGEASAPWRAEVRADLQDKAYLARAEADGALLVVARTRLVRVSPNGAVQNILNEAFWQTLYPNSLAQDDAGRLYIGMRHGVARLTLSQDGTSAVVRWLVPDKSFLHPSPAR